VASAAVLAAMTMTCGIRDDELHCEEAAAHLRDCCPSFDVHSIDCYYAQTGCGTIYPVITISESRCITSESCSALVQSGVCTRAQGVAQGHSTAVCP